MSLLPIIILFFFQLRIEAEINNVQGGGEAAVISENYVNDDKDMGETQQKATSKATWYVARTLREVGIPVNEVTSDNATQTSIHLRWKINPCANAYIVSYAKETGKLF